MFNVDLALIFSIELLISLIGFVPYTTRRHAFAARCAAALGIYMAGSAAIWWLLSMMTVYLFPLYFILVSVLMACCVPLPFETGGWGSLYAVTGAYLVQHLTYCISSCLRLFDINLPQRLNIIVDTYVIYAAISFLVWLILVRPGKLKMTCGKRKRPLVLLALITVMMCVFLDSEFRSVQMTEATAVKGTMIMQAYGILGCILALGLIGNMFERLQMESNQSMLEALLETEQKRSKITSETIEAINLKCHDLNHQLKYLEQHNQEPESRAAIEGIRRDIASYSCIVKTGNQTLDYVFVEKLLLCEKYGIRFTYQVDGKQIDFIENLDLITLCGNAIDNAIEYLQSCPQEKRTMSMTVREDKGCVFMHQDNYCEDNIDFEDGLPITTKSDKIFHGYGTQSIRHIVKRYGGELYISVENRRFNLDAVFQPPLAEDTAADNK